MATVSSLKKQLQTKKEMSERGTVLNIITQLSRDRVMKKEFEEILKERAPKYIDSIMSLVYKDPSLHGCDPMSIASSCKVAASLNLPVDKNLSYVKIVSNGENAAFQMDNKGYMQLAHRSDMYRAINVIEIYEGELVAWRPLTERMVLDFRGKVSDAVIGYAGYFKLNNGFRKSVYWPKEKIDQHMQAANWVSSDIKEYNEMAKKIVLKDMLLNWGLHSEDMQQAFIEEMNS